MSSINPLTYKLVMYVVCVFSNLKCDDRLIKNNIKVVGKIMYFDQTNWTAISNP